jgi:ferredoxin
MTAELRLDPIKCTGHGLCAELLPELIELDEWGYPIISGREVAPEAIRDARRAVTACPTLALRLQRPAALARAGRS